MLNKKFEIICKQKENVCLRNYKNNSINVDNLHNRSKNNAGCTETYCLQAFLNKKTELLAEKTKFEKLKEAEELLSLFYKNKKLEKSNEHVNRLMEIKNNIMTNGFYELTTDELLFGLQTAWRNSPRCIGRPYYSKLELVDARHVKTTEEMAKLIFKFYKECTNNGVVLLKALVFPQRKGIFNDFRIWNSQLINYACYKLDENVFIGDQAQLELTEICLKLGWRGKGTEFDILPLVLQADGKQPEFFEIPKDIVLEVPIIHPKYNFEKLKLKWFVTVSVSTLAMDIGGCQFTAVPFTGFYTSPEIARTFCDYNRYNKMKKFAEIMNLDTESDIFWKDRVLIEVNFAALYSYEKCNCSIIDHHTISEQFLRFFENEHKHRGGCPADWIWTVSQSAAHLDETFYVEMLNYNLKPSVMYQMSGWETIEELNKLIKNNN